MPPHILCRTRSAAGRAGRQDGVRACGQVTGPHRRGCAARVAPARPARCAWTSIRTARGFEDLLDRSHVGADMSPVEQMLRTGVWAPHNPVIRTLPTFQSDRVNALATARRHDKQNLERIQALAELRAESRRRGVSCNKYKDKRGALTSGLFT